MSLKLNFKELKVVFVDFDGTLVDTVPLLYNHYANFLKLYDREGSLEEFTSLMGPAIHEFIVILKDRHNLPPTPEELTVSYTHGLAERYKQEAKLMENSEQFLKYAKEMGLELALVTSSAHSLIGGCLDQLQLKKYFDYLITGEKVKKTKPDPEIYFMALKTCSAAPHQAVSIEDSYNGILSSLAANVPTIVLKNKHLTIVPSKAMLVNSWKDLSNQFREAYEK